MPKDTTRERERKLVCREIHAAMDRAPKFKSWLNTLLDWLETQPDMFISGSVEVWPAGETRNSLVVRVELWAPKPRKAVKK